MNNILKKIIIFSLLFLLSVIVAYPFHNIILNKFFNSKYQKITIKINEYKYLNLRYLENVIPASEKIFKQIYIQDNFKNRTTFVSREIIINKSNLESIFLKELNSRLSYDNFVKDEAIKKLSINKKSYNYFFTQFDKGGIADIEIIVKDNNLKYLDLKNFVERQLISFQDFLINHYKNIIKENIFIVKSNCRIEIDKEISFIEKILINFQNDNKDILKNIFSIYLNSKSNIKFNLDYLEYISFLRELKKNGLCNLDKNAIFNSEFLYLHSELEKQKQYLELLEDRGQFLSLFNPIKYEIIENSLKFEEIKKKRKTIIFTILFSLLFIVSNYLFLNFYKK